MAQRWGMMIFALVLAVIPFIPGMPPFWIVSVKTFLLL